MLVITLRTVTFIVAWRWCSSAPSPRGWSPGRRAGPPTSAARGDGRILIAQALEELDAGRRREGGTGEPA